MKTDRTVVITGAAGGMGTVFVRRFLDNGDTVIATDTSADSLAKLADTMNSDRLHIRAADITNEADTKALAGLAAAVHPGHRHLRSVPQARRARRRLEFPAQVLSATMMSSACVDR